MVNKIKWSCYLAGGMENVKKSEMINFREDIENKLDHPDLFIYNPVKQESEKVDKGAKVLKEAVIGINFMKRCGKYGMAIFPKTQT